MYSLFREHLLQHPRAPGVDLGHALRQLRRQLPSAQVNVEKSRLDASVPGERSDLLNIPIRPRQIGQAQVPRGVRGELRDAGTIRNVLHDFGPRPFRDWPPGIATRFRKE